MANIDIVYIPLNQAAVRSRVDFVEGMRVSDALDQSGLLSLYPELIKMQVGIFSQPVPLDAVVRAGDRIEFYRPLLINPMEKRRQRARSDRRK